MPRITISPSFTVKTPSSLPKTLLFQPSRLLPSKRGLKPSSPAAARGSIEFGNAELASTTKRRMGRISMRDMESSLDQDRRDRRDHPRRSGGRRQKLYVPWVQHPLYHAPAPH